MLVWSSYVVHVGVGCVCMNRKQQGIALFWAVALALYAACWFLPIIDSDVGYQGAGLAHIMFVRLFENPPPIADQPVTLFATVFYAIGWMANELFVLGIVTVWKWPRLFRNSRML